MKPDLSAAKGLWLKLKSKHSFLSVLSLITTNFAVLNLAHAGLPGDLIQDVELRTQYNFDEKDYNNTLRFKLGTLNSGSKNKILDLETADERSSILYLTSEMNISIAANNKKIKLAKSWRRDLSRVYSAYLEYLKSSPSSAKSSIELKVIQFFTLAEDSPTEVSKVKFKRALKKTFDQTDFQIIQSREANRLKLTKYADRSENSVVKFFEFGVRGNYDDALENEAVVRVGISLPLGFTGARVENRKKALANHFKIKRLKIAKELEFKKALSEIKVKKRLLEKMSAKKVTKSRIKKITSSSSMGAEDKLKVYLESLETKFKKIELRAELALLHNRVLALSANQDREQYIGSGL